MGSGGPGTYRWGYRDASGNWIDGANAPAGAIVGYFDEARRAWVEGLPVGWVTTYRMGYRDAATGQWVEGATAPAGSVIGWWDEQRQAWIEGIPQGTGIRTEQRVVGTKDTYVAPEPVVEKKSNWWPWLLAALAAAGLLYGLIKWRESQNVALVATPAAVATTVVETPEAPAETAAPAAPAATATTAPAPAATEAPAPAASPAAVATVDTGAVPTEAAAAAGAAVTEVAELAAPCVPKITAPDTFIAGLKDANLPIGDTVIYTADNDPDGLLGKDGGYDAAFGFADTSLPKADGLAGGGVIEFFKNPDLAKARAEQAVVDAKSEVREFFGPILVRLSGKMDKKQVDAYGEAIAGITGCELAR
ncbi:MAG: hypothetical protein ACKOWF_12800 [Chloroflexota bacterium]